jgi:hypothetical protein
VEVASAGPGRRAAEVTIAQRKVALPCEDEEIHPAKLKVRRETLRALADIELARAAGGDEAVPETGKELCHAAAIVIPPPAK